MGYTYYTQVRSIVEQISYKPVCLQENNEVVYLNVRTLNFIFITTEVWRNRTSRALKPSTKPQTSVIFFFNLLESPGNFKPAQ